MKLENYLQDGANNQARAVMCFINPTIEESWNDERGEYTACIQIGRWENCREQGYILSLRVNLKQLNIAFFEHRNSDAICAIKWEQCSTNSLTIDTADFGGIYKDKFDTSFDVGYGKISEMAQWIEQQFSAFFELRKRSLK